MGLGREPLSGTRSTDTLMPMEAISRLLLRLGHVIWLASIVNIGLGFFIPGFDPVAQTISAMGHAPAAFAYTHRATDVLIGICMCAFGIGLHAAANRHALFSMIAMSLLGASFISAGIWTLEHPLHLLYNLSIVVILVPVVCALELKELVQSRRFETLCLIVSFISTLMFWCSYAGFIPREVGGLVQRIWTVILMGWFGITAYVVERRSARRTGTRWPQPAH